MLDMSLYGKALDAAVKLDSLPRRSSHREGIILIADDAPDSRLIARRVLESCGYSCHTVSSGSGVVEAARTLSPDAILLDLLMPDLSGLQVLRQLGKMLDYNPKICVLSGMHSPEVVKSAFAFGAHDFLVKPIIPDMLASRLANLLEEAAAETFFSVNCQMEGTISSFEGEWSCRIRKLNESEVSLRVPGGVSISNSQLFELYAPVLQGITHDLDPVLVRLQPHAGIRHQYVGFLVGMAERERARIRARVMRGKYLSNNEGLAFQ